MKNQLCIFNQLYKSINCRVNIIYLVKVWPPPPRLFVSKQIPVPVTNAGSFQLIDVKNVAELMENDLINDVRVIYGCIYSLKKKTYCSGIYILLDADEIWVIPTELQFLETADKHLENLKTNSASHIPRWLLVFPKQFAKLSTFCINQHQYLPSHGEVDWIW